MMELFRHRHIYFGAFLITRQAKNCDGEERSLFIMAIFDDAILRQMYLQYAIPCDRLVSNPSSLQSFTKDYESRTGQVVEPAVLSHHLLNLRRRGEAKGGLGRLQRAYNGRN